MCRHGDNFPRATLVQIAYSYQLTCITADINCVFGAVTSFVLFFSFHNTFQIEFQRDHYKFQSVLFCTHAGQ